MPANLTPQYLAAEQAYREAKTVEEKILALEEMLAVIPKHKGTEKLQAEIKSRLAKLRQAGERVQAGGRGSDPFHVPREGAGQAALVGFPNVGKSSLLAALTRARPAVGDYPFTTHVPQAGMMAFEDVQIQLVDTPPITAEEMPAGLAGTLRLADVLLLVVNLGSDDCLEQLEGTLAQLYRRRILREETGEPAPHTKTMADCLLLGNKLDAPGAAERLALLAEAAPPGLSLLPVSAREGNGIGLLPGRVFALLNVIRVYGKAPGKEVDRSTPFILRRGSTVLEMAAAVRRDFPERLKSARVWGSTRFPGQSVPKDYVLADGDVVELHV
ncbi:MAG: TGS domain-containing protein [Firmicutes bacterium]|nr:TGS domain-containing protein [Bacillota bacterium]